MQSAAPVRGQRPRESDMLPQNNTRQAHQIIAAISVNSQSQTEAGLRTKESLYGSSLAYVTCEHVESKPTMANCNGLQKTKRGTCVEFSERKLRPRLDNERFCD